MRISSAFSAMLGLSGVLLLPSSLPAASGSSGKAKARSSVRAAPGTVLTFYGLRKLEQDASVSDEEKLREWQSFIERSGRQVAYAKKAIVRWKDAAKLRLVERAQKTDEDPKAKPVEKIEQWKRVFELYPKTNYARRARKRATFWQTEETKRLVEAAEAVERARKPKVDRIAAWNKVLDWVKKGAEFRAAHRRINTLQSQLYSEAQSVDKISRVDTQTKLAAWKDVLRGRPTDAQRKRAEARLRELTNKLAQERASVR